MDNEELDGVKFSEFPSQTPGDSDEVVGLHAGDNARFSVANFILAIRQGLANIFVPLTRTINGKTLNNDISLNASDVGAVATSAVGSADGVASLDSNGKVPGTQLDLSDKQSTITASGILKGDGAGGVSAATAGTDYQAPLTAGTDYATPAQLADKANQSQLAYVETGTTASQNYTAGQYISLNGLLYTADTAIASGATFYTSGGNKNLTECVGGGFNQFTPVFGTWTPNSNASALRADRCFYMISGGFLLVSVAISLVSNLSNHAEVDIISNLSVTFGRTLQTTAIFSTAAVAYDSNARPIRVQVGNNKLYIRNDSGSSLTTDDSIYGQIIIPVY